MELSETSREIKLSLAFRKNEQIYYGRAGALLNGTTRLLWAAVSALSGISSARMGNNVDFVAELLRQSPYCSDVKGSNPDWGVG